MDKFENYDIFKILDNWQKCIPHLIFFMYFFVSTVSDPVIGLFLAVLEDIW